jgi:hypothetical protein
MDLLNILERVRSGALSPADAVPLLDATAERNIGFARVDLHRLRRRGFPEVIYCPGKTADQIAAIMNAFAEAGQDVLATRISPEQAAVVLRAHPAAQHHTEARLITLRLSPPAAGRGRVGVVCAGTSDIPVAEEAALTAEYLGAAVERVYDVGVAGLHRLLRHLETLRACRALVVVAGMEGALPSVVGGLVTCPLVAVPTSVGYGTGLQGFAALLAMLNTCVPGITVVNIDNGFGAGVAAALINRTGESAA